MTASRSLSREQIAAELDAIRVRVIAAKWHDFNIPWAELENAYGDISCDALQRNFSTVGQLMSYVHEALRRDALDITKSAGFRASTLTAGDGERTPAPVQSPEHAVLAREARELLHEFLAELSERDRTIGYLYLDPSCEYTPRRIAAELGLPKREVTKTLDRVGIRLRRFTALAVQPGALCAHHRRDVLHWQQTGSLPLALRLHLRRCHACRCAQRQAREAVRAAILPLIPAATLPLIAPGALARLYHALGAHPAVHRAHDATTRVRKFAPVGGGGSAAIAAKLAVGSVVITAAALHAVTIDHTPKHSHPRHPVHRVRAHIASTPAITTTTPAATITAAATSSTTTAATPTPVPVQAVAQTTSTSQASTAAPPAPDQASAAPAPAPAPVADTAAVATRTVSSMPSAPTGSSGGGSSGSSGSNTENGPAAPGGPPPP